MAARGTNDGRDTVRELNSFRARGLMRDDQGRYYLAKAE